MDAETFLERLEKFCSEKPDKLSKDITKCHVCELRDFCYSPPACYKENCDLSKIIQFVEKIN
ncbi:MAG: hypothetical protein ACLSX5_13675 [Lachnospiraceae bacterium]